MENKKWKKFGKLTEQCYTKVNREDTGKLNEMEQKYSDMQMNISFNPFSEFEK